MIPSPGSVTTTLLYSTLDDQNAIVQPAAGVGGKTNLTETDFVSGHNGKGAQFKLGQGTFISFPMQQGEQHNVDFAQGEVEFWYKSNFVAGGDTSYRKFFLIGSHENHRGILLYVGDGTLILLVEGSGPIYREIVTGEAWKAPLWKAGQWVKIRVRWDAAKASDALQIYVNGNKVDGHSDDPGGWDLQPEDGDAIYIGGADEHGADPADGVIDEFFIRRLAPPI